MKNRESLRRELQLLSKDDLIELVLHLTDRVAELEARLSKLESQNSRNSSLPPSRDRQDVKKKTRSLRRKSNRKPGGQNVHKGTTLKFSEMVNVVVDHQPIACDQCARDLSGVTGQLKERKQVWDIPPLSLEVTEHRRYQAQCPDCGKWTCSDFPAPLMRGPGVRFGENLRHHICYLHVRQFMPYKRITEYLEMLLGQRISEGMIYNILQEKVQDAEDVYLRILNEIQSSQVVGVDESSCSVQGDKNWIWSWVTPEHSLFRISDNWGYKTVAEFFPEGFNGILTSDCWATHLKTQASSHQICLAHLRREYQGLMDHHNSSWVKAMDVVLLQIQKVCRQKRIPSTTKEHIEAQLNELLNRPFGRSAKPVRKLKQRMLRLQQYITTCLYQRKVPPDNNASDRAIRMIKLKMKISGAFRSWSGADAFAILRTLVDSAIKQGIHPFIALACPEVVLNLRRVVTVQEIQDLKDDYANVSLNINCP